MSIWFIPGTRVIFCWRSESPSRTADGGVEKVLVDRHGQRAADDLVGGLAGRERPARRTPGQSRGGKVLRPIARRRRPIPRSGEARRAFAPVGPGRVSGHHQAADLPLRRVAEEDHQPHHAQEDGQRGDELQHGQAAAWRWAKVAISWQIHTPSFSPAACGRQ